MDRRASLGAFAAGALMAAGGRTFAQSEDRSQITLYVGASSSMDICARLVAEQMREALGRPAVVFPRLGAGQRLALGEARKSAPDGRNLVFSTNGPFSIYPHVYTKLDYDPDADFTPIIGVSKFDVGIATGPSTGARTLEELIEWVRRRGGEAIFASSPGNGSLSHFVGLSTAIAAGIKLEHVPYKDSGAAGLDLMAGRIPILVTGISTLVQQHLQGKMRLLAVSGDTRSPLVPEVPTMTEAGFKVSASTYTGVFGPAKMPPELVQRLSDAIAPMRTNPQIIDKLAPQSMTMWPASGRELAAICQSERRRFGELVKAVGYTPEPA